MIMPSLADAKSPGPRGPDRFSPTAGRFRRPPRTSVDMWASCQLISCLTASGRSGPRGPATPAPPRALLRPAGNAAALAP